MAYRIEYDTVGGCYEIRKQNRWGLPVLTLGFFGLFLFLCNWFWPEGLSFLREICIPGDNEITMGAARVMTQQLKSGSSVMEALEAFCVEVIQNATGSY